MGNRLIHTIPPVYNEKSRILILGTFPSVKSREGEFFYHHPQNRFWRLISAICKEELPKTIDEKRMLLLRNRIALWDVVRSCDIIGSSDSSIKNVIPNDITPILKQADIQRIYANGGTAYRLYKRYIYQDVKREIILLPSTSPANASYSLERLIEVWSKKIIMV
ncbi:MAG TPA: DNA-deoxyinosine glycosylase [Clostridiales bacterium]|jgi:hypoxanthine-DNA glycosylase|nr:DNA-deoxyinosine glycosylase [Clostridiales bacterium]